MDLFIVMSYLVISLSLGMVAFRIVNDGVIVFGRRGCSREAIEVALIVTVGWPLIAAILAWEWA
jgi:hypothetical protein